MAELKVLSGGQFVPGHLGQLWVTCPGCDGKRGWYTIPEQGKAPRYMACPECQGLGRVQRERAVPDDA